MLLSGTSKLYLTDDGAADGFVMRVTPLGFVQWITYLNSNFQQNDQVVGAISSPFGGEQNIFAFFTNNHGTMFYRTNAIVKLAYVDGKMLWAKQVVFSDPFNSPPDPIYFDSIFHIEPDPRSDYIHFHISQVLLIGGGTTVGTINERAVRGYYPTVT